VARRMNAVALRAVPLSIFAPPLSASMARCSTGGGTFWLSRV